MLLVCDVVKIHRIPIDIILKAVYTADRIFFLVQFSDPDESRLHKSLVWNTKEELYENGPDREDCFVFKWAINQIMDTIKLGVTNSG